MPHHPARSESSRPHRTRRSGKPPSKLAHEALAAELEALRALLKEALRARWEDLYETACPPRTSRKLLTYAIAYRIQEEALGGLDAATRRRLDRAAEALAQGRAPTAPRPRVKPGTKLLREWQGVVHEVIVIERGVVYHGKTWPSLSAVAREITGARWSGPRFFGLTGSKNGQG
jgi:hypothetical protein